MKPLAFVDTEFTGFDLEKHEVIEVAIIRQEADGTLARWETRIKPQQIETADPEALEINGYADNPELWDDAPLFEEVASKILELLKGAIIVGHNPKMDQAFLQAGFTRRHLEDKVPYHTIDTVTLAYEHLVPCGLDGLSLSRIREFLQIDKTGEHTAMKDADDAMYVYQTLTRATWMRRLWWRLRWWWLKPREGSDG
jgi:DNA polymerase-3 subunit epsilon